MQKVKKSKRYTVKPALEAQAANVLPVASSARLVLLTSLVFLSMPPAQALENEVVVRLFAAHQPVDCVYIAGPLRRLKPANNSQSYAFGSGLYELTRAAGKFKLKPLKQAGAAPIFLAAQELQFVPLADTFKLGLKADALRRYRGKLSIAAEGRQLVCRNKVALKDYVSSVVGSETLQQFPLEALKAQAVLIQTAMLRYKKTDDLNDSTEKQAYLGADFQRPAVREAVQKTWNQTLSFAGQPVTVYFHAACAGGTSTSALFSGKESGLACDAAVPCAYCRQSPFWQQTCHQIPASVFAAKFPEGLPAIMTKDSSGRPTMLKYPDSGAKETGYSFWLKVGQRLGWDKMPGTRFQLKKIDKGAIELRSSGAGHGVGLCQWGACGMANKGMSYAKILGYYFPGAKLTRR